MPEYKCKKCREKVYGWATDMTCPECGGELVEIGFEDECPSPEQMAFAF